MTATTAPAPISAGHHDRHVRAVALIPNGPSADAGSLVSDGAEGLAACVGGAWRSGGVLGSVTSLPLS